MRRSGAPLPRARLMAVCSPARPIRGSGHDQASPVDVEALDGKAAVVVSGASGLHLIATTATGCDFSGEDVHLRKPGVRLRGVHRRMSGWLSTRNSAPSDDRLVWAAVRRSSPVAHVSWKVVGARTPTTRLKTGSRSHRPGPRRQRPHLHDERRLDPQEVVEERWASEGAPVRGAPLED
jgi:hypothetical protein